MKALLSSLFDAAVGAAQASLVLPPHLPAPPRGRTLVVGAGKAAAAMAASVEAHWKAPLSGLVVTRYGHISHRPRHIEVVEAAHPVPDEAGVAAATRMLKLVEGLSDDDLVLCLISGGGSALLVAPPEGITLAEKQALTRSLLRSGAPIGAINTLRKHLSRIKGGRLAVAAWPARILTLAISDVPGDDIAAIASGPTVGDPTTLADARSVLERYRIDVPPSIAAHLARADSESPKPGDPKLVRSEARIIAAPMASLKAAAEKATAAGYEPMILGDALEGEARELGRTHAELALSHAGKGLRLCLLSGGETSVTVNGKGKGGRNAEYLLGLCLALKGAPGIAAIACDTDGIDGSEDNAGAWYDETVATKAARLGLSASDYLARNDAYSFFEKLGHLIVTGPTHTNVNDFRAILVG
jgi:hydroxypyruvate reductase